MFFGQIATAEVTLLSFFLGAPISIIIIIYRAIRKKEDEYVPFGPFLVAAAIVVMFAGDGFVLKTFVSFCKMLSDLIVGGLA